ncbi:hypothetical protein ASPSYDRAFT_50815, partial [Aspergillus sydowii CBS 593.65]
MALPNQTTSRDACPPPKRLNDHCQAVHDISAVLFSGGYLARGPELKRRSMSESLLLIASSACACNIIMPMAFPCSDDRRRPD